MTNAELSEDWDAAATWTVRPEDPEGWKALARELLSDVLTSASGADVPAGGGSAGFPPEAARPLLRILRIVRDLGCETIVVESRYVDADYRSEYANYWASLFTNRSGFARRLHFFRCKLTDNDLHQLPPPKRLGYLGYTVLRPNPFGPVGRTVVAPPARYGDANMALVTDEVNLLGQRLTIKGAPFCQQDGEFLRCAHAAAWMCHYPAHKRGWTGRRLTAAFTDIAPRTLSFERRTPSKGMNPFELHAVFEDFGLPAHVIDFRDLSEVASVPKQPEPGEDDNGRRPPTATWDHRILSLACRYLNSGLPVLVGGGGHVFTLVGWRQSPTKTENETVQDLRFVAHDDLHGPYLEVTPPLLGADVFAAAKSPNDKRHDEAKRRVAAKKGSLWEMYMIPLPTKAYIPAETAENFAYSSFVRLASRDDTTSYAELGHRVASRAFSLRTMLVDGSEYRRRVADREMPEPLTPLLRHAHYSHFVWTVEVHDPKLCAAREPCVVAEIVYDSTSERSGPRICALILPGGATTSLPAASTKIDVRPWRTLLRACGTRSGNPNRLIGKEHFSQPQL